MRRQLLPTLLLLLLLHLRVVGRHLFGRVTVAQRDGLGGWAGLLLLRVLLLRVLIPGVARWRRIARWLLRLLLRVVVLPGGLLRRGLVLKLRLVLRLEGASRHGHLRLCYPRRGHALQVLRWFITANKPNRGRVKGFKFALRKLRRSMAALAPTEPEPSVGWSVGCITASDVTAHSPQQSCRATGRWSSPLEWAFDADKLKYPHHYGWRKRTSGALVATRTNHKIKTYVLIIQPLQ
jgi:hypothetical protein